MIIAYHQIHDVHVKLKLPVSRLVECTCLVSCMSMMYMLNDYLQVHSLALGGTTQLMQRCRCQGDLSQRISSQMNKFHLTTLPFTDHSSTVYYLQTSDIGFLIYFRFVLIYSTIEECLLSLVYCFDNDFEIVFNNVE